MLYHLFASEKKQKTLQKAARKLQGRLDFHGLKISIENRKGGVRKGTDPNGHEWRVKMKYPYGYIRLTEGADGEHVDCYVGDNRESEAVYVINQVNPYKKVKGKHPFDEHKVMLGFDSAESAKEAYLQHYDRPDFFGSMNEYDIDSFKVALGGVGQKGKGNKKQISQLSRKKGKIE